MRSLRTRENKLNDKTKHTAIERRDMSVAVRRGRYCRSDASRSSSLCWSAEKPARGCVMELRVCA